MFPVRYGLYNEIMLDGFLSVAVHMITKHLITLSGGSLGFRFEEERS